MIHPQGKFTSFIIAVISAWCLLSCQPQEEREQSEEMEEINLSYAKGFKIYQGKGFKVLEVLKAFPEKHQPYRYLIQESENVVIPTRKFDGKILLPAERVILTSTTHIPHLDYLEETDKLIGFPNLDLISSKEVRSLIKDGSIQDLGRAAQSNVEMIIDLQPDWIMISTLGDEVKNLELLKSARIPAVLNGEYVEQNPLGRAEWIKFTGALFGKLEEATEVFENIEKEYLEAEKLTLNLPNANLPKVMSGVMYKDIWYAPGNDSWGTKLLKAAGGQYIFEDQKGTGSVQLSYEYVLENTDEADFWIGAADFKSLSDITSTDRRYANLRPVQEKQVYTYTSKKGETGGVEYFELGYMRPDLILKDLIKILHPELLPDYQLYFYTQIDG
ncbi:ABC transporter substrate-binding protein [Litoribacter populi]|uniref:ABC transporter substrate-binding protein n=1 Tax=Litoribacter populi TaxID=2598460 RepID=UPI00117F7C59|nr:ABC transporter substrate-binding protein [Litoribacter populi]